MLHLVLKTAFAPEVMYWHTPQPVEHPERLVMLIKRTNATFPGREWSTHYWNGRYLDSGHYDLTNEEGQKDFDHRSKRGY
jgi:hypothetical protein